ncbi:hypothetical protein PCASD_17033 [Puccinia coronata f. sp. avenae]|uniref:No apical meristem-associated C-terminal domain-containing protein n=1 Tax=Puccinia coronata f. sp. avenae TaxID=200324 RepID=A0A2N5U1Q0_9BASI|nr:hypothetical protein PCASD_17033 [Puccinia coronata f. sp. avenae]
MSSNRPKKTQSPNFLPEEDEQLARSWAHVLTDPVMSNQQGKELFFACITNNFNRLNPGAQQESSGLQSRWKKLQKSVLTFCAIYQYIEKSPPSGSSPLDWLNDAKQAYYEKEGKQFIYERVWSFLKQLAKFQNVSKKGKAMNGHLPSDTPNVTSVASSPTPSGTANQSDPTESQTVGRNTSWKRPPGVRAEKRKLEESNFQRKKLKLLEKSNNKTALCIAEACRANDIQEKLARIDQNELDQLFMLQDINSCPDKESKEFFCARQSEIIERYRNPSRSIAATSSRAQSSSHQPHTSSEPNTHPTSDEDDSHSNSDDEQSSHHPIPHSEVLSQSEGDLPWLDPDLA